MASSQASQSFRDLLLRYRGRSGLTQRELAERVGVNRRSVQEWENGTTYPSADRLETLIQVLLEGHGLTPGQETAEAQVLWAAVAREAPRMHAALDQASRPRSSGVWLKDAPRSGARTGARPRTRSASSAALTSC